MKTFEIIFSFKTSKEDIKNFVLLDTLRHKLLLHPDFQRLGLDIIRQYNCYLCSGLSVLSLYSPHLCMLVKYSGGISSLNTKLNDIWRQICKTSIPGVRTNVGIQLLVL